MLVVVTGGALAVWRLPFNKERFNGPQWTVQKEKLIFTILERGSLESAQNNDIICELKARTPASTLASTIRWLVDDGSFVTTGTQLMQLDDSGLIESLKDQSIKVDTSEADWISADENYKIVISQNESDIKNAINTIVLAKLDLQKYIGRVWYDEPNLVAGMVASVGQHNLASDLAVIGPLQLFTNTDSEYQQAYQDVMGRLELAESDRDQWQDRAGWSRRMYSLGLLSKTQSDSDQSKLDSADFALKKVLTERQILDITKLRTSTDLRNKLEEAYRNLDRTRTQARAKDLQADSARKSKKSILEKESTKKQEIEDQIAKCIIRAPRDGLVIYFVSEQTRGGFGGKNSIVAQGESVIEGQKLMRIPNLSKMLVNVKVHEAMVSHVKPGQVALVQIDAFPGTMFQGHVLSVANQPSQADFFASDVKLYATMVAIDQNLGDLPLKPGLSARVTITADETAREVLTVPIQSVFGNMEMGKKRKVFVMADGRPEEREIVVGMNNDTKVEVIDGLAEGDTVVLNPGSLLTGGSSKMKAAVPKIYIESKEGKGARPPGDGAGKINGAGGEPKAPAFTGKKKKNMPD